MNLRTIAMISTFIFVSCDKKSEKYDSSSESMSATHDHDHGAHQDEELKDAFTSENQIYKVRASWNAEIKAGEASNQVELKFFDLNDQMISVDLKEFHPFMPMHGHGSNEDQQVFTPAQGPSHTWLVSGVYFSMGAVAGGWVIHVTTDFEGQLDQVTITVNQEVK